MDHLKQIKPRNVGVLINAALECQYSKVRQTLGLILKACADGVPEYRRYIEELGGSKLLTEDNFD